MGCTGHAQYSGWVSDLPQGLPLRGDDGRWGDQFHFVSFYLKKYVLLVSEHSGKLGGRIKTPLPMFLVGQRFPHSSFCRLRIEAWQYLDTGIL